MAEHKVRRPTKSEVVIVTMRPDLKTRLAQASVERDLSMAQIIRQSLERELGDN